MRVSVNFAVNCVHCCVLVPPIGSLVTAASSERTFLSKGPTVVDYSSELPLTPDHRGPKSAANETEETSAATAATSGFGADRADRQAENDNWREGTTSVTGNQTAFFLSPVRQRCSLCSFASVIFTGISLGDCW